MAGEPEPEPEFDAVAAAQELADSLGDGALTDEYTKTLEDEIEQLTALVAQKDELVRLANQRADQAHAEIEAVQRRASGAAGKDLEQRTRKLLAAFLPVVDNLDRAIAAAKAHSQVAELLAGVELVRRQLLTSFEAFGVRHAPARGIPFDPNRHDAVAVVPVGDPAQDGTVIDVMEEGYVIGDDTLRPARVAVGKRA